MIFGQESETREFKKSTGEIKAPVVDVAAMLNKHKHGELFFGIKDDGTVCGQMVSTSTLRDVSQALTGNIRPQIYPVVELVVIHNKECIRVQFQGNDLPYYAYGRAYIRVADENKQLSPEELECYIKNKTEISPWDSAPSGKALEDINTNTLRSYMRRANDSGRLKYKFTSKGDILKRLELLDHGNPCNTAVAMFGKKAQAEIQMAIFATEVKHTFIDIDSHKGTISDMVSIGEQYIRRSIRWRVIRDGSAQRKEIPEVPVAAVREALMNSYAHRDWHISQSNEIAIFSDRIEIYNPGAFPRNLKPQDFIDGLGDARSIRRNPLLTQIMYYSKDIEKFGTGLKKIASECDEAGVKYGFHLGALGFSVIFYRSEAPVGDYPNQAPVSEMSPKCLRNVSKVSDPVSETGAADPKINIEEQILTLIRENPNTTYEELAQQLGLVRRTIQRHLQKLKEEGKLQRIGPNRGGHWKITG